MSIESSHTKLTEQLVEDFGANASYVETLLDRYLSSPSLVDETWRTYFADLLSSPVGSQIIASKTSQVQTSNGNGANGQNPPAPAPSAKSAPAAGQKVLSLESLGSDAELLRGAPKKIVENMEMSLTVPTATSQRFVPVKLLDENRRLINAHLETQGRGKASFTHIIAWAIVRALQQFPQMNDGFFLTEEGPVRVKRPNVNIGIAVDMQKKDGSRSLLVPNVKRANTMTFAQFLKAYDDIIQRARANKLDVSDFEGTTLSLTNPGTIGTVGSVPRLMSGQSMIIATGAIEYPAEYQAMAPEALSQLGISKVVQVTNTYDHRIIQGAESGAMLARMHELLLGKDGFYEAIFDDLSIPVRPFHWAIDANPALLGTESRERLQMRKQASVLELINAYRVRGHLIADIDPLHAVKVSYNAELDIETYGLTIWDLDREFNTGGLAGLEVATLRKILETLRRSYCGTVGIEYRHIQSREEKLWIRQRIESAPEPVPAEIRKQMLWKLISAEQFEQFLHKNYLGQKRFSVEGSETVIAILDQMIERSAEQGVDQIVFGMAHRGRLNVVANVLGHYCERIFTMFEGSVHPSFPADEGDVKYHQGGVSVRETAGKSVALTLSPNPSHLEFVDPVVEGMVRAKQDALQLPREEQWSKVLPVLIHGDAAFAGQGIVMETLNLWDLKGYRVGGTIHIVVNNQIGFTTSPRSSRSTVYSTDIARMTSLPIFHINGDDPDAAYRVLKIALDFRHTFKKDVVLDIIGFRRLGHNETDEPTYTQPLMYALVKAHPGVRDLYAKRLIKDKLVTEEEVKGLLEERNRRYTEALQRAKAVAAKLPPVTEIKITRDTEGSEVFPTAVDASVLASITRQISIVPQTFHLNPKMVSQLARRAKMGEGNLNADWAFGEALAFGSLVLEGHNVRLSGQDSGRGTFSQRHAAMYDIESGDCWVPLAHLEGARAKFDVIDSSLSEEGVMGFEYGYSTVAKNDLVMWEAQFGDFANGAQVIVDQFISSGEDKWQQTSPLTLLLPHGYEGQGPEHSSGRLERYLQLCAENNMQVTYPTTPAQYFHLLRRQAKQERRYPLVVMTPKSLLRLPAAGSPIAEFSTGGFQPVLEDSVVQDRSGVKRIVLCSGKVYYDLQEARLSKEERSVAILRLEQFYPFPANGLRTILATYPNAKEIVWTQEEPLNMGGWSFVRSRLEALGLGHTVTFAGRAPSASPATGTNAIHQLEQSKLVQEALTV